jgi:hypothetical protein
LLLVTGAFFECYGKYLWCFLQTTVVYVLIPPFGVKLYLLLKSGSATIRPNLVWNMVELPLKKEEKLK